MKASDIYGSKYLCSADLNRKPLTAIIEDVDSDEFQDENKKDKTKLVLQLAEVPKRLIVNKTNAESLIEALGDDTDCWVGAEVTLYVTKEMYSGKKVDAIRIKSAVPPPAPAAK
jgi:hypothetical protein